MKTRQRNRKFDLSNGFLSILPRRWEDGHGMHQHPLRLCPALSSISLTCSFSRTILQQCPPHLAFRIGSYPLVKYNIGILWMDILRPQQKSSVFILKKKKSPNALEQAPLLLSSLKVFYSMSPSEPHIYFLVIKGLNFHYLNDIYSFRGTQWSQ